MIHSPLLLILLILLIVIVFGGVWRHQGGAWATPGPEPYFFGGLGTVIAIFLLLLLLGAI